ncbi:uncharacterized protein [Triticum aestivum]|uniref:uncharacterized protein n=1 Tax=Triticum aestivum TaxID=4565 RepID=UPI001D0216F0|nr:uncharacterized protein LOC123098278 [Triticum aestivum]
MRAAIFLCCVDSGLWRSLCVQVEYLLEVQVHPLLVENNSGARRGEPAWRQRAACGSDEPGGLGAARTKLRGWRRGCAGCDQAGGGGDQTGHLGAAGTKLDEGVERLETGPSAWIMGTTRARGGRRGGELLEEGDGASSWRRAAARAFGGRRRHRLLEDGDGASSWRMGTA